MTQQGHSLTDYVDLFSPYFKVPVTLNRCRRSKDDIISDLKATASMAIKRKPYDQGLFQLVAAQLQGDNTRAARINLLKETTKDWPVEGLPQGSTPSITHAINGGLVYLPHFSIGQRRGQQKLLEFLQMLCVAYNRNCDDVGFDNMGQTSVTVLDVIEWHKHISTDLTEQLLKACVRSASHLAVSNVASALCITHGSRDKLCSRLLDIFTAYDICKKHSYLLEDAIDVLNTCHVSQKRTQFGDVATCHLRGYFRKYGMDLIYNPPTCMWGELFADISAKKTLVLLIDVMPLAVPGGKHDPVAVLASRESLEGVHASHCMKIVCLLCNARPNNVYHRRTKCLISTNV